MMLKRGLWIFAVAALILGCDSLNDRRGSDEPEPSSQSATRDRSSSPAGAPTGDALAEGSTTLGDRDRDIDSASQRYLRLDTGTVLRAAPAENARAIHITTTAEPRPVVETKPPWFAVDTTDGSAWVRLSAQEAKDRMLRIRTRARGPRDGHGIDPDVQVIAQRIFGSESTNRHCGSYALMTDLRDPSLLRACDRLASSLDQVYQERFGVTPQGQPAATVILFAQRAALRQFAAETGGRGAGYAAYTNATDGYLAMHAQADRIEVLRTLTHELAHLVHRRALGDLPRWLSEGLADAIGDSATEGGFQPLEGIVGAEGQARRLLGAIDSRRAPGVERLVKQPASDFDKGTVSYDYETSALFVRYVLTDATLAPRMRDYLAAIAAGAQVTPEALVRRLEVDWRQIDRDLSTWLRRHL